MSRKYDIYEIAKMFGGEVHILMKDEVKLLQKYRDSRSYKKFWDEFHRRSL